MTIAKLKVFVLSGLFFMMLAYAWINEYLFDRCSEPSIVREARIGEAVVSSEVQINTQLYSFFRRSYCLQLKDYTTISVVVCLILRV
jgi:hypothetical protein